MNPRSDNSKGITFPDQQDNERSGTDTLLSEKDVKQHSDNIEQATTEENRFDSLMKMSRSLAHDLNNLLTTILANTQLASLMLEDEKIQSYEVKEGYMQFAVPALMDFAMYAVCFGC